MMTRFLSLSFLLLFAGGVLAGRAAWAADSMRVTVLMPVGEAMVTYSLTSQDSREFIQRWSILQRIDSLVPIDDGGGYRGVLVRTSRGTEYRIYDGIVRGADFSRRDDLRMLERWVLEHGPAEIVRPIIADLDRSVVATRGDVSFPVVHDRSASAIIERCHEEGRLNPVARVACLHRALSEQLSPSDYAAALEKLVIDPPYMASKSPEVHKNAGGHSPPDSGHSEQKGGWHNPH